MKPLTFFPLRNPFLLVLLSFIAFIASFCIAYQQDAARVTELGKLAWAHLSYAEELKDDMAVIDWSKNLEKMDTMRAFQATVNSKGIAKGGNQDYLPATVSEGVSYLFPSDWSFCVISPKGLQSQVELTMIFKTWPGPFFWGLFTFFACLICGCVWGLSVFSVRAGPPKMKTVLMETSGPPIAPPPSAQPMAKPIGTALEKNTSYLFIDRNYVIRQVSPEAAGLLKKKTEDLLNGHLFDLSPDPVLIQAFEKTGEAKISTPFPDHPDLDATLKSDPNGCLLILESNLGRKPL